MSLVWEPRLGDSAMEFSGDEIILREDGTTTHLTADQVIMLHDYLMKYRKLQEMAND